MKPADSMPYGEWRALKLVFAHVTKIFGDDFAAAVKDINRELANGRARAMVRRLADGKEDELPVEFWKTHKASSDGPGHITVRSKEYPAQEHLFFLRHGEELWPTISGATTTGNETLPQWPRKSAAGTKSKHDWELILIKAAGYMYENGAPKSLAELCRYIENHYSGEAPGKTQLEIRLDPLYREFKRIDGK